MVLVARDQERLQTVADQLESEWGIATLTLSKDLSHSESAQEIFDTVERNDIQIDLLVNNAAARPTPDRFDTTGLESLSDLLQINVVTLTTLTRLFVVPMVERGTGKILNVSSVAAEIPDHTLGVYAATKGYVSTLSNVLAQQLGPDGITVTVLVPGWTETDVAKQVFHALGIDPDTRDPMSPAEVAEAGYTGLQRGQTYVIPGQQYREAVQNVLTARASNINTGSQ